MEEHREPAPREDGPPHEDTSPPASDHQEPVERRSFFRRSAEVAALSLFGVGGLDPLIDRVAARVVERMGGDRLASEVARRLAESGVMMPRAHAAVSTPECPSDYAPPPGRLRPAEGGIDQWQWLCPTAPNFECPTDDNFACNGNTRPRFGGCLYPDFACEWGEQFYCQVDNDHFDCDKKEGQNVGFSCPPWVGNVGWFDCVEGSPGAAFNCRHHVPPFDCGGTIVGGDPGYLCPALNQFFTGCPGSEDWQCRTDPNEFMEECYGSTKECTGAESFGCETAAEYYCGRETGDSTGSFVCGADKPFVCGGAGRYDFICRNESFTCGGATAGAFACDTNHIFMCKTYGTGGTAFECDGQSFTCSTGGTRCNEPGTGDYRPCYDWWGFHEDIVPGDFLCWGRTAEGFSCEHTAEHTFECRNLADDFRCLDDGQSGMFTCIAPFAGCQTTGSTGQFVCNDTNGEFVCQPAFDCPAGRFAVSPP